MHQLVLAACKLGVALLQGYFYELEGALCNLDTPLMILAEGTTHSFGQFAWPRWRVHSTEAAEARTEDPLERTPHMVLPCNWLIPIDLSVSRHFSQSSIRKANLEETWQNSILLLGSPAANAKHLLMHLIPILRQLLVRDEENTKRSDEL